jgi:hypothetical protein
MIWTERENELRQIENIMNPEGKRCGNCQWSSAGKDEEITTCGHHIQNFSINSFCGYWTSPKDPNLLAYYDRRRKELKAKLKEQAKTNK